MYISYPLKNWFPLYQEEIEFQTSYGSCLQSFESNKKITENIACSGVTSRCVVKETRVLGVGVSLIFFPTGHETDSQPHTVAGIPIAHRPNLMVIMFLVATLETLTISFHWVC